MHSVPQKTSRGAQNVKTGPDSLGTTENESGSAKHENGTLRPPRLRKCARDRKTWKRVPWPQAPPKTITVAQNMKTGLDALGTAQNDKVSAKHENGTRRPRYRKNDFGSAK
jgi:hypothetical protein